MTSEGYYIPATGNYYYYLKDHLGNNRITYHYSGSAPVIDQEVEYYPFGSMFAANNLQNNLYLYNGKELNNEFFENYDYGKRFYDPQIGRFPSLDPLSDKFVNLSPYNYASNNPVTNIDLWGLQGIGVNFITDLMLLGSKYKSIISEAKAPAQRLLTGQTSLSNMPNEVTSQMGTQTKSMISTTSKLNDVNKVKQTGTKLISEVGLDVGKTAEKTGDALTGLGFAAAPFTEGASLALVPIGEQVSSAGLALQSGINYANGNFKESAGQVTVVGVSLLTNTLVGEAVAQSKKVGAITTVKEGRTQEGILNFIGNLFGKTTEVAVDRDKYKNK